MLNNIKSSDDVIFLSKFIKFIKKSSCREIYYTPDKEYLNNDSEVKHEKKDVRECDSTNCQRVF